jgi:Domain of unknown function (DUF4304)
MTASQSTTRQAIAAISRDYCRPLLRPHGFKTRGNGFWRETDGLLQDIGFQASMWGDSRSGRFTINVGVTHPEMYALFVRRPAPKNPSSAQWPITQRIGFLMSDKHDHWWIVDETTDIPTLGKDVASILEAAALPFLEALRAPEQLRSYLAIGHWVGIPELQVQVARALYMHCNGDSQAAIDELRTALSSISGKPGDAMVRGILSELEGRA